MFNRDYSFRSLNLIYIVSDTRYIAVVNIDWLLLVSKSREDFEIPFMNLSFYQLMGGVVGQYIDVRIHIYAYTSKIDGGTSLAQQ